MKQPLTQLEKALGYQFRDQESFKLALTHRSVHAFHNNERLEFLGDSILNFAIGHALFVKFPQAKEGKLSRLRASLVRGATLAEIARQFELSKYIQVGPGELKTGGASRDSTLADAVEAIIGAIYLEAGFDACYDTILRWYQGRLDDLTMDTTVKDNKTRLQEWLQSHKTPLPEYQIIDVRGRSHNQSFKVSCTLASISRSFTGEGGSRRHAEQQAAGKALQYLQSLDA